MTSHEYNGERPAYGRINAFDHVEFWVGNAAVTASWYVTRMGFERVAYKGLETGSRDIVTHVVGQGATRIAFSSPLNPENAPAYGQDMNDHIGKHGDGVKVVAFDVENARAIHEFAVANGATTIEEPHEEEDDSGKVVISAVKTYGDTVHRFIQRDAYTGAFLPGFRGVTEEDPLTKDLPPIGLLNIDHIVGNMPDQGMNPTVEWYEKMLSFHRFWSADDSTIHTEFSALRSTVMADHDEVIKMPINEPAPGKRKSQIQEYVEYYGGPGVQHIALRTNDLLTAITNMRARGMKFLEVPSTYYEILQRRLDEAGMKVNEDLQRIRELNILVDFDERGYLLQLFSQPLQDRPTVFLEFIQREGCEGFGAGNFQSLFEAIERAQALRGNLVADAQAEVAAAAGGGAAEAEA